MNDRATYKEYFTFDRSEKRITLNNDFRRGKDGTRYFITLSDYEATFLISKDEALLTRYYLYLKFYCGRARSKDIDTTAKQILSALGYSAASGKNISLLSYYNSLLVSQGLISIQKYRDISGRERNIYTLCK